jgi:PAS domain S-box-containing protein
MARPQELNTTTVRIQLPDNFLKSLKASKDKSDPGVDVSISDIENPVYRELLNNVYDAVIIADSTGNIQDFNHRSLDFFLYTSEELFASNIKNIIVGLKDSTLETLILNTRKKLLTFMEANCLRVDESTFPADVTVNKITLNNKDFLIFCIRNITRRKESEEELNDAHQELAYEKDLLHTLLREVPEYISFKGEDLKYIRINNALSSLFGLSSPQDAIGKDQFDFMPEETAKKQLEEDKSIFIHGKALINMEHKYFVNDQEIWVTSSKVPIRDKSGDICGIINISRDTTDRKKATELLMKAKFQAEEANKLKDDFIANITHELRTPLNPIIGFATIIKNSYEDYLKDKSLMEEHTNYILEAAVHLQSIIEDLLMIAKNDEKTEFKITTFSADALIAEIVNLHHFQITKNNINLRIESLTNSSLIFNCDRSKLFHILSNFLGNAVKFTPEKGEITIRINVKEDHIQFEVEDNGIGISEQDIEKIFDRFVQVENILTKSYAGTGLGLAIVRELSDVIGCAPYVISTAGKGSCFGIKVPPSLYEVLT